MGSSRIVSILSEPTLLSRGSSSWLLSSFVHGGLVGVVSLALASQPGINDPSVTHVYSTRLLKLESPDLRLRDAGEAKVPYPSYSKDSVGQNTLSTQALRGRLLLYPSTNQIRQSNQIVLLQSDVLPKLILPDVTIPTVVLASHEDSSAKLIVPPPALQKTAIEVRSQPELPNVEPNLSDIKIASSASVAETIFVRPSSTSPVSVRGPVAAKSIPQTASDSDVPSSSARVLSLSDLRATNGIVPLPQASVSANDSMPAGGSLARPEGGSANANAPGVAASAVDSGTDAHLTRRISLPNNGKFRMVVVGASLEEIYPEAAGIWNGRLAYTVYLHVGLTKNWILQYSQPAIAPVATFGSYAHIEAPWPTEMVVPDLPSGSINADAVLAHGFLNKEGRFEKLAIVFPPQCPLAEFILEALCQWQFRPATQSGQNAVLEVLMIIPGD